MNSPLLSHPGKLLQNHLHDVAESALQHLSEKDFTVPDYYRIQYALTGEVIERIVFYCAVFHDFGKATTFFQEHLTGRKTNRLSHHAELSSLAGYYFFLEQVGNELGALFVYLIILKHHGNLDNYDRMIEHLDLEDDIDAFLKQLAAINREAVKKIYASFSLDVDIRELNEQNLKTKAKAIHRKYAFLDENSDCYLYLLFNFLFSLLIFADKEDAIFKEPDQKIKTANSIMEDIVKQYLKTLDVGGELNRIRRELFFLADKTIDGDNSLQAMLSLNIPTGSGKTLNALNIALQLRNRNLPGKRIIYALPFTSIIDQNFEVFEKVLAYPGACPDSTVLLKHHYSTTIDYREQGSSRNYNESQFLTESWKSEITVTTFYQLFHTLFSSRNKNLKKFFNLINSIIIIDEIQAIPVKYFKLIDKTLTLLADCFHTTVIVSTATRPFVFQKPMQELVEKKQLEVYRNHFNRYRLHYVKDKSFTVKSFAAEVFSKIRNRNFLKVLLVLNTINSSMELYAELKTLLPDYEFIYLSTNILPLHRKTRIEEIKQENRRQIIVSTQLIEAGVDIDTDFIFRDFAPLDALIQTAGRANRNGRKEQAPVYIYHLVNEADKPFAGFIYDMAQVTATADILESVAGTTVPGVEEKDIAPLVEAYYGKIKAITSSREAEQILQCIYALNYKEIEEQFQLIKDYAKIDFFVCIDAEAAKVKAEYESLKTIPDLFERKACLGRLRNRLQQYIVSVHVSRRLAEEGFSSEYINFVDDRYYDKETGFFIPDSAVEFF